MPILGLAGEKNDRTLRQRLSKRANQVIFVNGQLDFGLLAALLNRCLDGIVFCPEWLAVIRSIEDEPLRLNDEFGIVMAGHNRRLTTVLADLLRQRWRRCHNG